MTSVVWALVAASSLYWGFKLFSRPPPVPANALLAEPAAWVRGDLSRLFGAEAPPAQAPVGPEPAADSRFQLLGVVSPRAARAAQEGLALIAVDGKPARAYRVGAVVDGQTVLQAVGARGATLGPRDGAARVALNLVPPQAAATGQLAPPAGAAGALALPPLRPTYTPPQPMPPPQSVRRLSPPPGAAVAPAPPPPRPDAASMR